MPQAPPSVHREGSTGIVIAGDHLRLTIENSSKHLNATGSELGAKVEGLATLMSSSEKHLSERLDAAARATTDRADALTLWTKRLVFATVWLGAAAVLAAAIQAYAALASAPQIINLPRP